MSIGNILEARDQQLLDLFQKNKVTYPTLLSFLKAQLQFFEEQKKIQDRAQNHFYELTIIKTSVEEIFKRITDIIKKNELFKPKLKLVENTFQVKTKKHEQMGICNLCHYQEPNRIEHEIVNVKLQKRFSIESINLHSMKVHHDFSYLGSNSHWNVEPLFACIVLEIRTQEEIDAALKSPKLMS